MYNPPILQSPNPFYMLYMFYMAIHYPLTINR